MLFLKINNLGRGNCFKVNESRYKQCGANHTFKSIEKR